MGFLTGAFGLRRRASVAYLALFQIVCLKLGSRLHTIFERKEAVRWHYSESIPTPGRLEVRTSCAMSFNASRRCVISPNMRFPLRRSLMCMEEVRKQSNNAEADTHTQDERLQTLHPPPHHPPNTPPPPPNPHTATPTTTTPPLRDRAPPTIPPPPLLPAKSKCCPKSTP